jgi:hypothetical protein
VVFDKGVNMFDKPQVVIRGDSISVQVASSQVQQLLTVLEARGFEYKLAEGEFGIEDRNTGNRADVSIIDLADGTDLAALRKVVRGWNAK